ncbi:unnamed protein product [Phytophthora lilii]|uniref:Unnamed protein product n=1 Tax=Phytophthora lilii TaxID=2077276 RepID=A0A9W6TDS9_9STRA|nr:unnamed protein product [Phytophthora lilii]
MQQPGTRLRCDPTDYAKRQQEKKERAKQIREQRQRGVFSDEHTFAPKVNSRARNPSPPASREELDQASRSLSSDSMAYQKYGHNNNHQDTEDPTSYENDALDNLSRRYPKKAPATPPQQMSSLRVTPLEPDNVGVLMGHWIDSEHDTLFREVKRATGREIEDLPIKKTLAAPRAGNHTGPCHRNSSCGCPKCAGSGLAPSSVSNTSALDAPIRRREPRSVPATDPYRENNSRAMVPPNEMGMSRRKSRSAPTNQASLFVEKNTPSAVVHSARLPSSTIQRDTPTPPPRQPVAPRRAPTQAAAPAPPARRRTPLQNVHENSAGDIRYPPPITTGFNLSEELYADGAEEMEQCHNCNRKFNVSSFQKHQKICEKVFSGQRKVFNMAAKRLEGTEAEKLAREAKAKSSGGSRKAPLSATEQPIKVKSAADWKQKSEMFRNAMKASRDVSKALKEGKELPPMMPSAPDPSLIQCEYCSRRFNEKAAERHINFCREKSQRDNIKATSKRAPVAKPGSRAAAMRKR